MTYDKSEPFVADPIDDGEYRAKLTKVKECLVPIWVSNVKSEDKRRGFRFVFKIYNKKTWVCKAVALTSSDKGALYKLLCELFDSSLRQRVDFNKEGFCNEESSLYKLAYELVDKDFMVKVVNNGKYLNYVSAYPLDVAKLQAEQAKADDIPFGDHKPVEIVASVVSPDDVDEIPW